MEPTAARGAGIARRTLIVSGACFVLLALAVALTGTPPGDAPVRDAALALAALDITDELFRARGDKGRAEGDLGARLGALATLLERATPPPPER